MKKIISLLLALALTVGCIFALVACGDENVPDNDTTNGGNGDNVNDGDNGDGGNTDGDDEVKGPDIYALVAENAPTKIVTQVDYVSASGDTLPGFYSMSIEGNNSILEYFYSKLRTFDEALEDGDVSRVKTIEGVVYYKDGKYSEDGKNWTVEAPDVSVNAKFDLRAEYLTNVVLNDDGTVLEADVTAENSVKIWGNKFDAKDTIKLIVETNGKALSKVSISYTTVSDAAVSIVTSYTSAPIVLEFPAE